MTLTGVQTITLAVVMKALQLLTCYKRRVMVLLSAYILLLPCLGHT